MPLLYQVQNMGSARLSFLDRTIDRGFIKQMLDVIDVMALTDVDAVADLHFREIPNGVLTELGPSFLSLFYRQVVCDPHARGYVIRKEDAVVGFIAGSSDPEAFFKGLFSRYFFPIGFIVLGKIVTRPSFLPRFLQRVLANLRKENIAESLAAAMVKEYRENGYGIILLKKLFDDFRLSGVKRVQCDVAVNNDDPAIITLHQMYQKGGYVQCGRFRVGNVEYKRYRRDLR